MPNVLTELWKEMLKTSFYGIMYSKSSHIETCECIVPSVPTKTDSAEKENHNGGIGADSPK